MKIASIAARRSSRPVDVDADLVRGSPRALNWVAANDHPVEVVEKEVEPGLVGQAGPGHVVDLDVVELAHLPAGAAGARRARAAPGCAPGPRRAPSGAISAHAVDAFGDHPDGLAVAGELRAAFPGVADPGEAARPGRGRLPSTSLRVCLLGGSGHRPDRPGRSCRTGPGGRQGRPRCRPPRATGARVCRSAARRRSSARDRSCFSLTRRRCARTEFASVASIPHCSSACWWRLPHQQEAQRPDQGEDGDAAEARAVAAERVEAQAGDDGAGGRPKGDDHLREAGDLGEGFASEEVRLQADIKGPRMPQPRPWETANR